MLRFTTLALIIAASTAAYAKDVSEEYADRFADYQKTIVHLKHDPIGQNITSVPVDVCTKDIAKAKVEGIPADARLKVWFDGEAHEMGFAEIAKEICAPYERARQVSDITKVLWESRSLYRTMTLSMEKTQSNPELQTQFEDQAKDCLAAADRSDKLGFGDQELITDIHFDEARAQICEPLKAAAATWAKDVNKARTAEYDELAGPYKKVGIKGDKLQFCVDNAGHYVRGLRASSLTPAQMKKASVMFVLWEESDRFSLHRYVFKGDKLVNTTKQEFLLRPGVSAYR